MDTAEQADGDDDGSGAPAAAAAPPPTLSPEPNVKIKMTKSGITFSGPNAYLSNMSKSEFVYKGQPYSSSEQGLQHQNALHHKVLDIAAKLLNEKSTKEIKSISHDIPKTEEWKRLEPGILWDMMDCKFSQNPPLMDKLLKTAPHRLIEASVDSHWGRGAPYGNDIYEQGIVPGRNTFGDKETTYRDQKLAQKAIDQTPIENT